MCMKGIIIRLDSKVAFKINRIVFVKYLIICEGQNLACGLGVRALEVDRRGRQGGLTFAQGEINSTLRVLENRDNSAFLRTVIWA